MSKSELQVLLDRIDAFPRSAAWNELDADTRLEITAATSNLLRQKIAGVDMTTRLHAAQKLVTEYDIP